MPTRKNANDKQTSKATIIADARAAAPFPSARTATSFSSARTATPFSSARTATSFSSMKAPTILGDTRKLTVAIGREAAANFKAWFERNFTNPRAGRIGSVSYSRAGELDDCRGDWTWYPSAYGRAFWDHTEPLKPDEEDYIRSHPLVMLQLALGVTDLRGLRCLRRGLTLRANALQQKAYRSRYYASDNARRRLLAAERRKIRRRATLNPCPTPEGFREAFARVKESAEAKIRFGGMVHDLACYVDSCLRYDGSGNIVGRNGGIRAWIAENVPELSPRYKTVMRYKALAMRVRQMAGLEDPQPTSVLLDGPGGETGDPLDTSSKGRCGAGENRGGTGRAEGWTDIENYYAQDSHSARRQDGTERRRDGQGTKREPLELERGRLGHGQKQMEQERGWLEQRRGQLERKRGWLRRILAECRNTFKDVFDRIDSELGRAG